LVVACLRRLCPETLYPAAAFLLQSQPNLVDEASAQPPIEQAVQWLRSHEDDFTITGDVSDPASSATSPAWLRASARARDFLAKARLTQWVATCNDQRRFAPGTAQVAGQWARLRSDVDVAVGAEAAPAPVGVPSRMFLCRWRRRWNLRWGGLRCRDNFADGELIAKARFSPTKHRTNAVGNGSDKGPKKADGFIVRPIHFRVEQGRFWFPKSGSGFATVFAAMFRAPPRRLPCGTGWRTCATRAPSRCC
jgi:hypothetical protein